MRCCNEFIVFDIFSGKGSFLLVEIGFKNEIMAVCSYLTVIIFVNISGLIVSNMLLAL